MVLLTSSLVYLNNNRIMDNFINIDDNIKTISNNIYIIICIGILLLFTTVPAVLVAINCNRDAKLLYGIIGFFFSDIYLLQWSIKKFIINEKDYCKI
jgi:hypothetical protein